MIRQRYKIVTISVALLIAFFCVAGTILRTQMSMSDEAILPQPATEGGMPLLDAMKNRKTDRNFSDKLISQEMISNLLWATNAVNRSNDKHTIPSALNQQGVKIYVVQSSVVSLFIPKNHSLKQINSNKKRTNAPLMFVYTVDTHKQSEEYATVGTGFMDKMFTCSVQLIS